MTFPTDPGETNDVFEQHPDVVRELDTRKRTIHNGILNARRIIGQS